MGSSNVVKGASCSCSEGTGSCSLVVTSNVNTASSNSIATVNDFAPIVNLESFVMCSAKVNPLVIAATAAALGTPTPAPCTPMTASPWEGASELVTSGGNAVLLPSSTLSCSYGGDITIDSPGQTKVTSSK